MIGITHEIFKNAVQNFSLPNEIKKIKNERNRGSHSNWEGPISYSSYNNYEKFNKIEAPFIDNEARQKELQKLGPPPTPTYNQPSFYSTVKNIEDILNEPGRTNRPSKIIIFIRGAPNSGKSFLANKIIEHEKKFGNQRIKFCTQNRFYVDQRFNRDDVEKMTINLSSEVQDCINESFYTFILVEIEGEKLDLVKQCAEVAKAANYSLYGIDVHQTVDVCKKYMLHSRSVYDTETIAKEILKNPFPHGFHLINPIELIDPDWKAKLQPPKEKTPSPPPRRFGRFGRFGQQSSDSEDSDEDYFVS